GRALQGGSMEEFDPMLQRAHPELVKLGTIRLLRETVEDAADEAQVPHVRHVRAGDAHPAPIDRGAGERAGRAHRPRGAAAGPRLSLLRALCDGASRSFACAQLGEATAGERLPAPPQLQALGLLGPAQLAWSWNWLPDYPEYGEEIAVFGDAGRLRLTMPAPYTPSARAKLEVERVDGYDRSVNPMTGQPAT